jgi:transcriptional regulator GlxA family with amidase domain
MKIAFILYNGLTSLDFVGFYDPVTRLKSMGFLGDLRWDFCGVSKEVQDLSGLVLGVNKVKPDLSYYDMIYIPGGYEARELMLDAGFLSWLQTAWDVHYKVSVCTGSLLLGAAGFLKDKKATTHPTEYDLLQKYCKEVVKERIVQDGTVITGGGVATSVDLGLYMCNILSGREAVERIQKQMDYPYYHF